MTAAANHKVRVRSWRRDYEQQPSAPTVMMATLNAYQLGWPTGESNMLLVSVGTGKAPRANEQLRPAAMNLFHNALTTPLALIGGALNEQDLLCRVFGICRYGATVDRELGALRDGLGTISDAEPLFSYVRYHATLTRDGLDEAGFPKIEPAHIQQMDEFGNIADLQHISAASAAEVSPEHIEGFL
jgi:hypothetical protein